MLNNEYEACDFKPCFNHLTAAMSEPDTCVNIGNQSNEVINILQSLRGSKYGAMCEEWLHVVCSKDVLALRTIPIPVFCIFRFFVYILFSCCLNFMKYIYIFFSSSPIFSFDTDNFFSLQGLYDAFQYLNCVHFFSFFFSSWYLYFVCSFWVFSVFVF